MIISSCVSQQIRNASLAVTLVTVKCECVCECVCVHACVMYYHDEGCRIEDI